VRGRRYLTDIEVADALVVPAAWLSWMVETGILPSPEGRTTELRWAVDALVPVIHRRTIERLSEPARKGRLSLVDLRVLSLRMIGLHEFSIGKRVGLSAESIRRSLWRTASTVLAGIEPQVLEAWEASGADVISLARRSNVGATAVRLIREGFPATNPKALTKPLVRHVESLWQAGASWREIEKRTRLSQARLERSGQFDLPTRWYRSDVTDCLGWSNARIYQAPKGLPIPDGHEGDRPWWWPKTIQEWANTLAVCPECGGRFATLAQHSSSH
jgi:hypothetical protein